MRDKVIFAALTIAVSFVLFGGAALLKAAHYYEPLSAGFALAAVAVMIATRGHSWGRKAVFAAITLGVFTAFDLLTYATGLRALSSQSLAGTATGSLLSLVSLLSALVPLVFPLAMLAIFIGKDPSVLWTPPDDRRTRAKKR